MLRIEIEITEIIESRMIVSRLAGKSRGLRNKIHDASSHLEAVALSDIVVYLDERYSCDSYK